MLVANPAQTPGIAVSGALVSRAWWSGHYRTDPTKTREWRVLRDAVVSAEPVCWLRFPGICTRVSTTADHVIPKTVRPELAMTRSNLRGACAPCNHARGRTPVERLTLPDNDTPPALDIFG